MNIIRINPKTGHTTNIKVNISLLVCLIALLFTIAFAAGVLFAGWEAVERRWLVADDFGPSLQADLVAHKKDVESTKLLAEEHLSALSVKMAEIQARVMRLDALGERLIKVAKLHGGEFDFSGPPAVGGPDMDSSDVAFQQPDYLVALGQLSADVDHRAQQLKVMESLLANRQLQNDVYLAGRPITWGWMSSRFGRRTDPFTGRLAWHKGVDFAGKDGSDIISIGSGVVTWAGQRYGYGLLVEISHGGGLVTRYAHAKEILVAMGDIVKKGDAVALMGSTGRSTGPHVHFEVIKNGKAIDPARYVNRQSKG